MEEMADLDNDLNSSLEQIVQEHHTDFNYMIGNIQPFSVAPLRFILPLGLHGRGQSCDPENQGNK